jgi:hypothetical protein
MAVSTGTYSNLGATISQKEKIVSRGNILFAPGSEFSNAVSHVFSVDAGQVIVIDAYNFPEGLTIQLNRVLQAGPGIPTGASCPPCGQPDLDGRATIQYEKPMDLGCGSEYWRLTQTKTQMVIAVPGSYVLELNEQEFLSTDLYVEYIKHTRAALGQLPEIYFGGVC